jgi:ABC-type dipeptide/oligopeptide/nickel transport system permease subunit
MATVAEHTINVQTEVAWELPEDRPFHRRVGRLAKENPVGAVAFLVVVAFVVLGIIGPYIAPYDPVAIDRNAQYLGPSAEHPFGTTQLGRDVFSRIIAGTRISLWFGAMILLVGFIPGTTLGILSGYFGRWVDYLIQRSSEAWTAFPQLPLLLTFVAAFGPGLNTVLLVVAIGALFSGSRIMRVVALVERHKEYVTAARATGATEARILLRHVLPNIMPFILVGISSVFAIAVLAEAALSFLGLGVTRPTPGWGIDLSDGLNRGSRYPHLVIFPGIAISLVVLAFNLLGDTLRDILDPRLRGSTGARR